MRARNTRAVVLVVLGAAVILLPNLAQSRANAKETRVLLVSGTTQTKASNVSCALRAPVQAVFARFGGFAARLSEDEVSRVRTDPEIYAVVSNPASWVVRINSRDPAEVEARTRELERELGFTSDQRYNTPTYRGFAAVLGWAQLDRLGDEPGLSLKPDPWVYIVFYVRGVDVDSRTDELERRYGFTARFRFRGLGGFSASLTKAQLGGIATESDIELIGGDTHGAISPSRAACVRTTPRLRRLLRTAFVRAHPTLVGKRLRGPFRVRIASDTADLEYGGITVRYALGSFSHPRLAEESQPELFRFSRRWRDLMPTNGVVCTDNREEPIPPGIPQSWFLPPAGANCYRAR